MAGDSHDAFDDAVRVGNANAQLTEMARRHCLRMTFTPCGGQGYAEAVTGLPINMRQVGCPVANGGASVNLELVVGEFYDQHCVGCEQRDPTGDVPNLATLMDERKAKAAQARAAAKQRTRQAQR